MLMNLTLKHPQGQKIDIQVNRDQVLAETLAVLAGKGIFLLQNPQEVILQSERTKKKLNVRLTYEESQIYTGDILTILE